MRLLGSTTTWGSEVAVRAIRGATQVEVDQREQVLQRTGELMQAVLDANGLDSGHVISIVLTATPDLRSEFPAVAVRAIGITDVPLMCAQEMDVADAMPRVIRLLAHVETDRSRREIRHVYLHGTTRLRDDLNGEHR